MSKLKNSSMRGCMVNFWQNTTTSSLVTFIDLDVSNCCCCLWYTVYIFFTGSISISLFCTFIYIWSTCMLNLSIVSPSLRSSASTIVFLALCCFQNQDDLHNLGMHELEKRSNVQLLTHDDCMCFLHQDTIFDSQLFWRQLGVGLLGWCRATAAASIVEQSFLDQHLTESIIGTDLF